MFLYVEKIIFFFNILFKVIIASMMATHVVSYVLVVKIYSDSSYVLRNSRRGGNETMKIIKGNFKK